VREFPRQGSGCNVSRWRTGVCTNLATVRKMEGPQGRSKVFAAALPGREGDQGAVDLLRAGADGEHGVAAPKLMSTWASAPNSATKFCDPVGDVL
jgi:hypothetical protein